MPLWAHLLQPSHFSQTAAAAALDHPTRVPAASVVSTASQRGGSPVARKPSTIGWRPTKPSTPGRRDVPQPLRAAPPRTRLHSCPLLPLSPRVFVAFHPLKWLAVQLGRWVEHILPGWETHGHWLSGAEAVLSKCSLYLDNWNSSTCLEFNYWGRLVHKLEQTMPKQTEKVNRPADRIHVREKMGHILDALKQVETVLY